MELDCTILHLEDDDNDSLLFERVLTQLQFKGNYHHIATVQEAIDYLSGAGDYANRNVYPLPHVLVTDSVLGAGKTTAHLTEWLDGKKEFRNLTRIVLAGDISHAEEQRWRNRGVACVLPKGANLEDLTISVKTILNHCADPQSGMKGLTEVLDG